MNRKQLNFSSLPAIIQEMIEDSSSAAKIIDELIETKGEGNATASLIILDDMNIRGVQISNLYNKLCNKDIDTFYEKILTMTAEDIESLNFSSFAVCKYKAIYDGSSIDRSENPLKYIFTDEERNSISDKKNNVINEENKLEKINKDFGDLYPTIKSKEALEILEKYGFICGYEKSYKNKDGSKVIYRLFYNDLGDIIYTHSLVEPDIFLWGQSKLNVVRQSNHQSLDSLGCNAYMNVRGVVGYNIELREKPFETYRKILDRGEKVISQISPDYYDSNLIPVPESITGINYKKSHQGYSSCVIAGIYDLLKFFETYNDMDAGLKRIYDILLSSSEFKAYDEIIYNLNTDQGISIALELQDSLGVTLEEDKLLLAKERFCKRNNRHFEIPKPRFLSRLVVPEPLGEEINNRISKILSKEEAYIK